jgi:hypothetical protein
MHRELLGMFISLLYYRIYFPYIFKRRCLWIYCSTPAGYPRHTKVSRRFLRFNDQSDTYFKAK